MSQTPHSRPPIHKLSTKFALVMAAVPGEFSWGRRGPHCLHSVLAKPRREAHARVTGAGQSGVRPMDDTVEKKVKQSAREATERVQESSTKAAEGLRDCQTKMIAAAKANVNAMFDYAQEAIKVK